MSSAKAVFGRWVGKFLFTAAKVTAVSELAPGFRHIEVEGEALKGVAWAPGDKVQVFLDGEFRTYTPVCWEAKRGATAFVGYAHGQGPGSAWVANVKAGDAVDFFGPRGSVSVTPAPVVLVGDETSFAVALALETVAPVSAFFEVNDAGASRAALGALGLKTAAVLARDGERHWEPMFEQVRAAVRAAPEAQLVLTGRAKSIQALKWWLRASGLSASCTKAYWADGKRGLD